MFRVTSVAFACALAAALCTLAPALGRSGFIGTPSKSFFGHPKTFARPGKFFFGHKGFPFPPPSSAPGTPPPPPAMTNVRTFGAKGDGITDDTAAIQSAAQDAFTNNRTLYFPTGTYVHTDTVTFTSIAVTGDGSASVLKATDQLNSAVVLTGLTPSLQNMTISTAALTPGNFASLATAATLLVQNCAQFKVSNCTFLEGGGRAGIYVTSTIGGNISACAFDGAGLPHDTGVFLFGAGYINLIQNLFQNEDIGIALHPVAPGKPCVRIFIASNTIGNVSYPVRSFGIYDEKSDFISVQGNVIQMANSDDNTEAIQALNETNMSILSNNIWGGSIGIATQLNVGPSVISQNTISNSGLMGVQVVTINTNAGLTISNNTFGECGLKPPIGAVDSVFSVFGLPLNNPSSVAITNNVYAGHINHLTYFIQSRVSLPNIAGNTQTQTTLPNSLP